MKNFTKEKIEVGTLKSITCDICKIEVLPDDFAAQEFININHTFGYGAKLMDDMSTINVDICEACLKSNILDKIS